MLRTTAVMLALAQAGSGLVDAADGEYTLENGGKVSIAGVCQIDGAGVGCWDRTGKRDDALTKRIAAYYGPDSTWDVPVRPGKKNRYVVFRRTNGIGLNVTDAGNLGIGTAMSVVDGEALEWARFVLPPDATEFDAFVNLSNVGQMEPVDLPVVRGRSVEYAGYRFETGDSKPVVPSKTAYSSLTPGTKAWGIYLSRRSLSPQDVTFRYVPVDKEGKPIRYVDKGGQPVSEEKVRASIPQNFNDPTLWKGSLLFQDAMIQQTGGSGGEDDAFFMLTNVNPARLGAIRIIATDKLRIRFPSLPADPRP